MWISRLVISTSIYSEKGTTFDTRIRTEVHDGTHLLSNFGSGMTGTGTAEDEDDDDEDDDDAEDDDDEDNEDGSASLLSAEVGEEEEDESFVFTSLTAEVAFMAHILSFASL